MTVLFPQCRTSALMRNLFWTRKMPATLSASRSSHQSTMYFFRSVLLYFVTRYNTVHLWANASVTQLLHDSVSKLCSDFPISLHWMICISCWVTLLSWFNLFSVFFYFDLHAMMVTTKCFVWSKGFISSKLVTRTRSCCEATLLRFITDNYFDSVHTRKAVIIYYF